MITVHHISIGWNTATTCIGRQVTRDALGTRPQKAMLRLSGVEGNRISQVDASMQSPEIWTKLKMIGEIGEGMIQVQLEFDDSILWFHFDLMDEMITCSMMGNSSRRQDFMKRDEIPTFEWWDSHTVSETRNLRCHFWLFGLFGLFGFWILCLSSCNFSLIPRWGSSPRGSSWAFQKHKRMPNAPREAAWATSDLCILYNLYNLYYLYIYISIYYCIYYCITIAVALLILQCHDSDPTCLTTLEQVDGTLVGCKSLAKRLQWHAMACHGPKMPKQQWPHLKVLQEFVEKGNRQNLEIQIGVTSKWLFL